MISKEIEMKKYFAFVFLILAMLACNLSNPSSVAPTSPSLEPTTVVYVVIEPTFTPTIAVTDAPEPTATTSIPPEVTLIKDSNCRLGPSNFYNIADQIAKEKNNVPTVLPVTAQNEDGTWWQVINATNRECWIFNENTQPNSDFSALPIKTGPALPAAPTGFFVTGQLCQPGSKKFEVSLSWQSGSVDTQGYRLYRNSGRIAELKVERLNYRDINAPLDVNLTYELEAYNENGTSPRVPQIVPACK